MTYWGRPVEPDRGTEARRRTVWTAATMSARTHTSSSTVHLALVLMRKLPLRTFNYWIIVFTTPPNYLIHLCIYFLFCFLQRGSIFFILSFPLNTKKWFLLRTHSSFICVWMWYRHNFWIEKGRKLKSECTLDASKGTSVSW